jgi:hypothetical protein
MSFGQFRRWHELLSCVLYKAADDRQTAAEYEWALAGGEDWLTKEAFLEWQFDVLEAWAVHPDFRDLVLLGEELLEMVIR